MVTLTTAENALKSVYLGAVTELLNTQVNPLMAKIEQTQSDVWGKEVRKAVSVGINGGIGAGDETGALPAAHGNNYLQFVSTLKNLYGQIEISDKAIRASSDDRGAFTDLLNAELDGLLKASRFNLGRMLYGDGSGTLATLSASALAEDTSVTVSDSRNLIEGMVVDIHNTAGTALETGLRITAIDRDDNEVTFDQELSANISSGSKLSVQGSRNKEITGLGAIFDTSKPLYGVSRSTSSLLNPYIKSSVGEISETAIQEAIDAVETNSGSTIDFIAVSADVKYAYQEYMQQYRRNIDILNLDGGFKSLSFNGIPVVYDRFVPSGTMYLLDTRDFHLHQLCDWRFLETENGKILRQNQGYPTYTATLVKYCDLICDRPNGQAKLSGITASTT